MSLHHNSTLDTLREESPGLANVNKTTDPAVRARNKNTTFPKGSSSIGSSNSKTIGLGIARRPSDNLLLNMAQEEQLGSAITAPPSRKKLISRFDRPASGASTMTESTELFSSDPNSTASSSNGNSPCSSPGTHLDGQETKHVGDETSLDEAGDESTLELTTPVDSEQTSSAQSQHSLGTRYVFTNAAMARSQVALPTTTSSCSSPLKHPITRTGSMPNNMFSKSTPALPQGAALTPSQRYRLRKEQGKVALHKSLKQREKYYDDQESGVTGFGQESDIDDSFIWNIPVASHSTNSFLASMKSTPNKSNSRTRKSVSRSSSQQSVNPSSELSFLDYHEMPPSPVPGLHNTTDFQFYKQTSENLSSVYKNSSNRISQSKLWERTASAEVLPLQFKTASDEGMEDLQLVSEDKIDVCSPSRPTWLPPKDQQERRSHEQQISKTLGMASLEQLDRSKDNKERLIRNGTNRQKYVLLLNRGVTRQSSLHELKKLIWSTKLTSETRRQIYDQLLQSETRLISDQFIVPLEDVAKVLNQMQFPRGKELEITNLMKSMPLLEEDDIPQNLLHLLRLKSISQQGLLPGDELLFFHFLRDHSFTDLSQVWEMVHLIQLTCFNSTAVDKFDSRVVNPRGVIAHYLNRDEGFNKEFNSETLNFGTWWNILRRLDHSLFMWCLDIVVVHNSQCFTNSPVSREKFQGQTWDYYQDRKVVINYKILCSLMLNVLLNYHFGFNDLKSLAQLNDKSFRIPGATDGTQGELETNSLFVQKWQHYYKKF
ncbi:LAMI_0E13168g1_1 [Lachancea mirantina]|uniref:LAMI_0E13168g1_1 n=1 Tax=Lachancea mirantina TaxID=1230905 RepID=A0A1G4JQJ6_9SACH|nr:LAMI_0E13168g1_1 [Lachancea mirantina]